MFLKVLLLWNTRAKRVQLVILFSTCSILILMVMYMQAKRDPNYCAVLLKISE